jgi:hypothetical protein
MGNYFCNYVVASYVGDAIGKLLGFILFGVILVGSVAAMVFFYLPFFVWNESPSLWRLRQKLSARFGTA